ncbi:lysozyme inhibitor LprI family protein [Methylobacterium currus]|uniref:lysozyme inhibitor LprI family protein n=1 Tax=Methylobacterium currus TaxID=2051553 RepID=UPI001FCFB821|nr:lysozyme inhibitor LprI family protein [Methylobacterium currus]
MRRGSCATGLVLIMAVLSASAPARAAAPRDKPVSAAAALRACTGKALPEYRKGACLDDAAKALRERLGALVERKLAAIAAVATRTPSPGSLAGREDAENWRKAFLAAQAAWEEYFRRHCDSLYDFDYHGGSAAGQLASSCKIRLLGARIAELQE